MFIAKMTTRYPDFHGTGYYNFIMNENELNVYGRVEDNSHDFELVKVIELDEFANIDEIMQKYPTKESLNKGVFNA